MSDYFDYSVVTSALIQAIGDGTGLPLIEGNSAGEQPEYPFCTYSFTSPKIDIERDYDGLLFELVVSITWHDKSSIGVLNLSKKSESYLKSTKGRKTLADKGIVIVTISSNAARDNFISIDYERMAGFDLRLRVRDTYTDDVEPIDSISINQNGGTN